MLTPKRRLFASNYVLTGNGVQSAISSGYAPGSAHVESSRMLKNAEVVAAVATERERLRQKSDLKAEDVIAGLCEIAEDESAPHSARVAVWRNLGLYMGLFAYNAVAEGALAFMKFLAGDQQAITGDV